MKHRLLKAATMPDDDRIDQMENDVKAIVLSLSSINDTLNTHTDMLAEILAAATEEPDEDSGIAKTLSRIFQALETQNENLVRIGGLLSNLGGTVENAVLRGVQRAVNQADEDGVVED
jgi:hypothetical protein